MITFLAIVGGFAIVGAVIVAILVIGINHGWNPFDWEKL